MVIDFDPRELGGRAAVAGTLEFLIRAGEWPDDAIGLAGLEMLEDHVVGQFARHARAGLAVLVTVVSPVPIPAIDHVLHGPDRQPLGVGDPWRPPSQGAVLLLHGRDGAVLRRFAGAAGDVGAGGVHASPPSPSA